MTALTRDDHSLQTLRINHHDPRGFTSFLQLSHQMAQWKTHLHDSSWWLEQETQCLQLFQQYGYDLQSGLWFCLIACQRSGWTGIASASRLFVDGMIRQQKPCWPPLMARDLRRQLLESYCTQILPLIYALPEATVQAAMLEHLLTTTTLLQQQAVTLDSTQQSVLQQFALWLGNSAKAKTKAHAHRTVTAEALPHSVPVAPVLMDTAEPATSAPVAVAAVTPPKPPVAAAVVTPLKPPVAAAPATPLKAASRPAASRWRWMIFGMLIATGGMQLLQAIDNPAVVHYSSQIWPDNPLVNRWRMQYVHASAGIPADDGYTQLLQQLNALEIRLLDAEAKRKPYMTISELKTQVYQMQTILRQQEHSFENQLNAVQALREQHLPVSSEQLSALKLRHDALEAKYRYLSQDAFFNGKLRGK